MVVRCPARRSAFSVVCESDVATEEDMPVNTHCLRIFGFLEHAIRRPDFGSASEISDRRESRSLGSRVTTSVI